MHRLPACLRALACLTLVLQTFLQAGSLRAADRPNILWITTEDIGPQLGCYGDRYAITPNLDEFAKTACRYDHCWSNAPVCAPARTTIITGMYPTSLGAENMRSLIKLPESIQLYPYYLRAAGYYCTNNSKTDYNVESTGKVWDESNNKAHWKNRPAGQPFFAIFNHTVTHESQIRNAIAPQDRVHDPAQARVPAYHPDTPEVRKDWAQYYDRITMTDKLFAQNLKELHDAGLAEDTIVFFYGDHGSGMPRSKRFPYNSGLRVPLLIHIPEKWKSLATPDCVMGGASQRLVSFVDLAPTLLSLCGAEIPGHMQGHAFLGPKATETQPYLFGFRGRMDERIDMVRSVTDGRYVYIRNFMPHLPHGQHVDYMFQTPTTQVWHAKFLKGELNEAQSHFWREKPVEELYDLQSDPDEIVNLAGNAAHEAQLRAMRQVLLNQMRTTRDLGFIPEAELHRQTQTRTTAELGMELASQMMPPNRSFGDRDISVIDYGATVAAWLPGNILSSRQRGGSARGSVRATANRPDGMTTSLARYWTAIAVLGTHGTDLDEYRTDLRRFLEDESPSVRIVAAEALGLYGNAEDLALALPLLLDYANAETHGVYAAIAALNAIDRLGEKADSIRAEVAKLPRKDSNATNRTASYCDRLIERITKK